VKHSPGDAGGFGPRKLLTGYLAPDGTHYPCEACGHRAAALSVCRDRGFKREPLAADDWRAAWVDESSDDPLDPEQELDRRSFVRIQSADRDDFGAVQFFASHYDTVARLTDAQKTWLRVHGYARQLRELTACERPSSVGAAPPPAPLPLTPGVSAADETGNENR